MLRLQRSPLRHQWPRSAISTSHKLRVTFRSLAWRGRICLPKDGALVSLHRLVSTSTMTKAITSVIVVACNSAWLFRRVLVRRHVLNKWPISARSAYTPHMALRTVPKLARQSRSRHVMVRTRVRERNKRERSARNPSGDPCQLPLLGVQPRLSRTRRTRSVCRPEANSRMNNFDPMIFTLAVVVKSWACSGRNGVILLRFRGHRCNVLLCMLVHT